MKENSIEEDIKILEGFLDLARTRDYKGDLTGSFDEFELEVEEKEYKALKMAKMIEVTDGDLEAAKNRISKLVRDVNQCITLLSEN